MKNSILLLSIMFGCLISNAQAPQLIPYQAIARDNAGNPVINQNIGLRFSIHDQTITGTVVWQENQTVVSNTLGIIVTAIGGTTSLTTVDWGNGSKFLQVEMDITGGTSYIDMGTQQMMSVPYALYAENAGTSNQSNTVTNLPPGTAVGNTMYWNGTQWVLNNQNIFNAGQNVGIDDSNPLEKLSVNGNITVNNNRVVEISAPLNSTDGVNAETIQFGYLTFGETSGSNNNYSINVPVTFLNYAPGFEVTFKANFPNTGETTLAVNGLSPIPLVKDVSLPLVANDIITGQIVRVIYDGTNFQVLTPLNGVQNTNSNNNNGTFDPLIFTIDGF
jgi:hypothetical protein